MVEKVSVACPHCSVRVRMPTYVRPGKKPKCPKCKTIIRQADVLPPELIATAPPDPVRMAAAGTSVELRNPDNEPVDPYAVTKSQLFVPLSKEVDPYAETRTIVPPVDRNIDPPFSELPRTVNLPSDPVLYAETKTVLPEELPPVVADEDPDNDPPPWAVAPPKPAPLDETTMSLPGEFPPS